MNFFDHKDLGNHLLQLCPNVVKHPVYAVQQVTHVLLDTYYSTYQSLRIELVQNAPEDGLMRFETCRANISAE